MLRVWAMIDRDMRKYFRSPALISISLLLPLLQLLVIGYAFGGKIRDVSVALVDLDRGAESLRVREKLQAIEANARTFRVEPAESLEKAIQDTRDGTVVATIVIPENYTRNVNQQKRPRLGLVVDNTDPFVVSAVTQKMRELLEAVNQPLVTPRYLSQVALEVVEIFPYVEYIEYLLPGSITLAIFVCTLFGGGVLYVDDKARGFHEGYLVTPISKFQLVLGLLSSGILKATFAGLIVTGVGILLAGTSGRMNSDTIVLLVLFIFLVSFSLVSFISLLMVRVKDPVIPRATIGVLNTLLFFPSGAMYPISSFPTWLQAIATVDPFTYAVHGLRALLLKNVSFSAILSDVVILLVFSIVCSLGTLLIFPRRL